MNIIKLITIISNTLKTKKVIMHDFKYTNNAID